MKDVAACDKSRWGGKQPLTRECPNGETYIVEDYMSLHRGGVVIGNRVKWNISVTRGKEKKGFKYFKRSKQILSLPQSGFKNLFISEIRASESKKLLIVLFS